MDFPPLESRLKGKLTKSGTLENGDPSTATDAASSAAPSSSGTDTPGRTAVTEVHSGPRRPTSRSTSSPKYRPVPTAEAPRPGSATSARPDRTTERHTKTSSTCVVAITIVNFFKILALVCAAFVAAPRPWLIPRSFGRRQPRKSLPPTLDL